MSKQKTISGHYDTVYHLDHNNRVFVPANVDVRRIPWNYSCVAAGQAVCPGLNDLHHVSEFWKDYKELNRLYWSERSLIQMETYKQFRETLDRLRGYSRELYPLPHNFAEALMVMLFLPILIPCGIYLTHRQNEAIAEWEQWKDEQWLKDMTFKAAKQSLRQALRDEDLRNGSSFLHIMDTTVAELGLIAEQQIRISLPAERKSAERFATIEEIYDKLYEPSFREFQNKQRPCRRYDGTYLQQIREGQNKATKAKQQSKNAKRRVTAEAFEIVIGIGDMDNTGYENAFADAKRSEALLGDYCDHLLAQPNLCYVTTKELNDPAWEPPFRNGLIILNLALHADEATPGIHLTCIPYSRNCKRGPAVQASMGRALTGMGYPSTWVDVLDENGERIPKRNKNNEIVYNKDGTVRYQQKPDKQGIIDWIEEQKRWIQKEMKKTL